MPPFTAPRVSPPLDMLHVKTHQPPSNFVPMAETPESPLDSFDHLKLSKAPTDSITTPIQKVIRLARPAMSDRSSTDPSPSPSPSSLLQMHFTNVQQQPTSKHRNRSPYSRSHLRSRSSGAALLSAPTMTRAHSMPNPHIGRSIEASHSGMSSSGSMSPAPRSPARARSPFRQLQEEGSAYGPPPRSPVGFAQGGAIESIQEDIELDVSQSREQEQDTLGPLPQAASMVSFTRSASGSLRRRPASPLHSLALPPAHVQAPTSDPDSTLYQPTASSGSNSPSLGPQRPERFNEAFPSLHHYASTSSFSSMPSTPTSARSRSPSISSLDTIEDAPDAESEAIEDDRLERLKLAAERQERMERGEDADDSGSDSGARRRSSLDVPRPGAGFAFRRGGSANERKRWSVCGGERRGDLLDLETIWED